MQFVDWVWNSIEFTRKLPSKAQNTVLPTSRCYLLPFFFNRCKLLHRNSILYRRNSPSNWICRIFFKLHRKSTFNTDENQSLFRFQAISVDSYFRFEITYIRLYFISKIKHGIYANVFASFSFFLLTRLIINPQIQKMCVCARNRADESVKLKSMQPKLI